MNQEEFDNYFRKLKKEPSRRKIIFLLSQLSKTTQELLLQQFEHSLAMVAINLAGYSPDHTESLRIETESERLKLDSEIKRDRTCIGLLKQSLEGDE